MSSAGDQLPAGSGLYPDHQEARIGRVRLNPMPAEQQNLEKPGFSQVQLAHFPSNRGWLHYWQALRAFIVGPSRITKKVIPCS